ncbi:xylose repressor [Actinoplanes sp. NBRC 14428]|uniref:Putative NBD/HSP70 family sugar kinase n=1 Tax=Pseudosporangium ferrugineum TaxID=439699 RepID=A0A2T0S2I1_9ACTN|nr:ROK family protein [Pseudosporangium ferrugineum]PRY27629.1 putative NBD/HSP70 family sugar kinase [Pseudosporangium ferrugineum]BCJ55601.1 xylose repressor [Actinoplanes sp. NBRC 14428]
MTATPGRLRAEEARWHTASRVLAWIRQHPGATRAALTSELQLASGLAAEVTGRLRASSLLVETPAPRTGRGRPTTLLGPHPAGPVLLALDVRTHDWRSALVTIDGALHDVTITRHASRAAAAVLAAVRERVTAVREAYGPRLRAVSVAVAGTVYDGRLVQSATLGWRDADLGDLAGGPALLLGNDATLAGVAEARTGAAVGASTALHLMTGVGIGGTVTAGGRPVTGSHGAAGEYGHQPYGDKRLICPCGARGCWDLEVDGRALARHLGVTEPADPIAFARAVLRSPDPAMRAAVATVASALGGGVGALVNAHDPALVTLGGAAAPLRRAAPAAFDEAYRDALMAFHRVRPPEVVDAAHGEDGPLQGAAVLGLDHVTSEAALAEWAAQER